MSTILHISDLHLGKDEPWERRTDDKAGIVPADENSRLEVLKATLEGLKRDFLSSDEGLDVLVVSGDVTSKSDPGGFERFGELIQGLAPFAKQVLVVPGNHDVDWGAAPSTPDKYAHFLAATRKHHLTRPYCDGVDDVTGATPCDPILELDDVVIVAINSANWCGVEIPGKLKRAREIYDVARVSEAQLSFLTNELRDRSLDEKVKLAVIHHHLLPVTEDEEAKPFESFTNLQRLRNWLREHGFHGVLHGHKHASTLTWDHVYDLNNPELDARRILTVSAPSPSSWGEPICRVLRVGDSTDRVPVRHAPRLVVDTVYAERPERELRSKSLTLRLDEAAPKPTAALAIDAHTADEAYERLVDALDAAQGTLHNVTCVVRDPDSANSLPSNYRGPDGLARSQDWLDDAVTWWQLPAPALVAAGDASFNHGERLYATGAKAHPLEEAARRLGSTKATVFLTTNAELRSNREVPAFVAVQLVLASDEEGRRLDCVGYFRKQDLTLWWPINIAELRAVQRHVLDLDVVEGVRPGRLVTIAAEAIRDDVLPKLVGTAVDRAVDLRPDELSRLAYGVAHGSAATRDETHKEWVQLLKDIGEYGAFPSLGVRTLIDHLEVFRKFGGKEEVVPVIKALEALYDRADRASRTATKRTEREQFSTELFALAGEVLTAVEGAIGGDDAH